MSEMGKNNNSQTLENAYSQESLSPMTCELVIDLHEKLRYTRFISTMELEKLNTCHNIERLHKYFEIENKILDSIFIKNPDFKNKLSFQIFIELNTENEAVLELIQEYTSIDYIRHSAKDFKDENISGIRVFGKKNKKRFYISDIEIENKQ
ncbi:MAG: hypothetical protein PHQ95_02740 [Candidatus Gracilibacteria bacterium]|nr:hypothetical protein [Candidatus Gracilibacteria bacterium]